MWSTNSMNIHLDNNVVIFHGSTSSSSGHILRGYVSLDLHSLCSIASIELTMAGYSLIGNACQNTFLKHRIQFLEDIDKCKNFYPGLYKYHFEFPLPGNLPESVESYKGAGVRYCLTAVAKRASIWGDFKAEKELVVRRTNSLDSDNSEAQELLKLGEIPKQIAFCLHSPSTTYKSGSEVPLNVGIKTLAEGARINRVQVGISESIRCKFNDEWVKPNKHQVTDCTHSWNSTENGMWVEPMVLKTSTKSHTIQPDCDNDFIQVTHSLEITISMSDVDNVKKFILIKAPIKFTSSLDATSDERLPSYDSALIEPPCYSSTSHQPLYYF
ncbi:hypothetical protein K493DRAFT_299174 [Basidiobolus meristosporus CBS 931.73]|uniref:Arrestin C-terminal-like domain-containing protein n=1 Tax=Basidiobolus meristosporus CBS 931.73 TaxID=1314790 RepID=A0A1Y1YQL9_9FUNG|nr:hypothetical protein K493DRAFT_299174 [Basidiobolus meristosporus CBS 931.73]|eukprot:ORX99864.1 hypothetical protein K493DRAFT_299174 [Basidiobolus meristosporus CBS 931.73]